MSYLFLRTEGLTALVLMSCSTVLMMIASSELYWICVRIRLKVEMK